MKNKSLVKKPSKKERLMMKRLERQEMLKVDNSMKVTLECPDCNVQEIMTLDEYFKKINYGSPFPKKLRCEMCPDQPELMFYKVNMQKIKLAGFNWERKRQGISEEVMLDKLEGVDDLANLLVGERSESKKKIAE